LNRGLGGHHSLSGHGGEEKNSQPLPGLESLIIQPIAQRYNNTTELSGWDDDIEMERTETGIEVAD
jgi:hypothetical protein